MEPGAIFAKLCARFSEGVTDYTEGKDASCKIKPDILVDVSLFLRDEPELAFDFLQCVSGVDWIKQSIFQVVYHLYSYPHRHSFVLKVDVPRDNPIVPSVTAVWPTANWQEREQYDLLGILFSDHPDLRRLLMPDDWDGHPMRKDWKEPTEYRGMPTTRYSPLELLTVFDKANPQVEGRRPAPKAGKSED